MTPEKVLHFFDNGQGRSYLTLPGHPLFLSLDLIGMGVRFPAAPYKS